MLRILERGYTYRFEIFLSSQLTILFGSVAFQFNVFELYLQPLLFLLNIVAGIFLISKRKKLMWFFIVLFVVSTLLFGTSMISKSLDNSAVLLRLLVYFLFHIVVTWNIIHQIWLANFVNKNVIIGLVCGYVSLGFLAYFIFTSIELLQPGSFQGISLTAGENLILHSDAIMYYAYITLLTIGYGEIVPLAPLAQKAAILTGLMGQFYTVIITSVVIGKYVGTNHQP